MKNKHYQYLSEDSTTTVLSGDARRASLYLDGVAKAYDPAIAENKIPRVVLVFVIIVWNRRKLLGVSWVGRKRVNFRAKPHPQPI
jgi:hypothetical protein